MIFEGKIRAKKAPSYFFSHVFCLTIITMLLSCLPVFYPGETFSSELRIQPFGPRIEIVTFRSKTLQREKKFSVVLPLGYEKSKCKWSSLLIFHGRGRNEQSLIRDEKSRNCLLAAPFVIVLPAGDDGWYIDSPALENDRYQTYIEEVMEVVTEQYNLSRRREARGLSGWSMGGYGAVLFAEKHPPQYSCVAPMIGLLDFPRRGLPQGQTYAVPTKRFGDDPEKWKDFNPINRAGNLRDTSVLIITANEAFDRTMNENFAGRLKHLGTKYQWQMLEGQHTFDIVREALPHVLVFMGKNLERSGKN